MTKRATFETNRGTFVAELYDGEAPQTVANFEKLANSGFYDGVKFHRVIPDFVVQGGDPYSKGGEHAKGPPGTGGPGYTIPDELVGNPHKHAEGALSMAHAGPNTGGSQFFVVLSERNTRHLDGVHTVFGKVIEGLDDHEGDQAERRHDLRARRLTGARSDLLATQTMSSHPHHDVSHDKGAAFTGLILGLVLLGGLMFGMVKWTNGRYAGHEGGEKPAAEAAH